MDTLTSMTPTPITRQGIELPRRRSPDFVLLVLIGVLALIFATMVTLVATDTTTVTGAMDLGVPFITILAMFIGISFARH